MKRFLLKLSGEALSGTKGTGFDEAVVKDVAEQVKHIVEDGSRVGIVIGGGNFWRGRSSESIGRIEADQIGMLATVMNAIYTSEIFRSAGMKTQVFTAFAIDGMTDVFSIDRVEEGFSEGKVLFFAGGTGHPYFSTDTATALRAIEIKADAILLAKSVDGVYDSDPKSNPDAKKYDTISISEVVEKDLGVIDASAAVLIRDHKIPMLVFGLSGKNSIQNAATGEHSGTVVTVD